MNKNVEIVKQYINYYNTFQVEKMTELFTENCLFQNISNTSQSIECHGKKELLTLAKNSVSLFSKREQKVLNWIIGENKIAIEIDYEAILAIDLPNGLKKDDKIFLKGISIFEFESDKIKRLADFS